ncbi:MAG: hypothetical protein HC849_06240 [Oscillatoriales cyanobacterium RU_3_3]|nr:hypothetical protein [Oscillatoriales cyanobacterium RU_3_3]
MSVKLKIRAIVFGIAGWKGAIALLVVWGKRSIALSDNKGDRTLGLGIVLRAIALLVISGKGRSSFWLFGGEAQCRKNHVYRLFFKTVVTTVRQYKNSVIDLLYFRYHPSL